jgi:hypothetical protein
VTFDPAVEITARVLTPFAFKGKVYGRGDTLLSRDPADEEVLREVVNRHPEFVRLHSRLRRTGDTRGVWRHA